MFSCCSTWMLRIEWNVHCVSKWMQHNEVNSGFLLPADYRAEGRTRDCLVHIPFRPQQQQHHLHTKYTWLHPLDFQRNLQFHGIEWKIMHRLLYENLCGWLQNSAAKNESYSLQNISSAPCRWSIQYKYSEINKTKLRVVIKLFRVDSNKITLIFFWHCIYWVSWAATQNTSNNNSHRL